MGVYGRSSSGFYGYRFRLTFPLGADVAAIATAYVNLSYVQSVENPVLLGPRIKNGIYALGGGKRAAVRVPTKVVFGALSGAAFTAIGFGVIANIDDSSKGLTGPGYLLIGAAIGSSVGFPLGVTAVDPYDSLPMTLLAGVIPGAVGTDLIWDFHETGFLIAYVAPIICSLIASELWRKPPQSRRVSFALAPTLNGGLSAAATLRF